MKEKYSREPKLQNAKKRFEKPLRLAFLFILIGLFIFSFIIAFLPLILTYALRIAIVFLLVNQYLKAVYLPARFFWCCVVLVSIFIISFPLGILFPLAQGLTFIFLAIVFADIVLLFHPNLKFTATRKLPKLFSLGDPNSIKIIIQNKSGISLNIKVLDELPMQFQKRDFQASLNMKAKSTETFAYNLRPTKRGEYIFNDTNIFLQSRLGLVERKITIKQKQTIPVYPSVVQMKKYELLALARISIFSGVKKMRKLGHSYEFEQIRNYVKGDDYRSINWKATSRRNEFMVNQYEDERSQHIFSVIDKGRSMKMPFEGLSLMDYAINSSLVISNIALQKHDKAGLLTFSDKIGCTIKAESGPKQLRTIIEALYREKERNLEANFELLYQATRQFVRRRSLLFLYTNFESYSAMTRALPILRRINHLHLLVVVFFENTEILDFAEKKAHNTKDIYNKTIAMKFVEEKHRIVQELRQYGVHSILTRPEDLSIKTVNKYLELKARGVI